MEKFFRVGEPSIDSLQERGIATAHRYGQTLEVFLRPNDSPGCFKVTGEVGYVREAVRFLLDRFGTSNP